MAIDRTGIHIEPATDEDGSEDCVICNQRVWAGVVVTDTKPQPYTEDIQRFVCAVCSVAIAECLLKKERIYL
jgi:hypothetical protein